MPLTALPDRFTVFATESGKRLRLDQISDGTGLLSNDSSAIDDPLSIVAVNGGAINVSSKATTSGLKDQNGGLFRVFQNGDVDFRFTPDEVDIGATTGFEYTVTDVSGDRDTTTVNVRWVEVAPNYDLFAATVTTGNERIAKQDDGSALLWGQKSLDDAPITIAAINGDPDLVAPVSGSFRDFFIGSNSGQFRVLSGGVVDFATAAPIK